ncbi:MAG: hypothetical protein WD941_04050 [Opitutus sp.]
MGLTEPSRAGASTAAAPGMLVKIDKDGTRTTGRLVNREFRPAKSR